jgi:hypothetical protein
MRVLTVGCMTPRQAKLPTLLALIVAALTWIPGADASEINYANGVVTFTAAPGEYNSTLVSTSEYSTTCGPVAAPCLTVNDRSRITAYGACWVVNSSFNSDTAACPVPDRVVANVGDRDDSYWDWDGPSTINGGDGTDIPLQGNGGDDAVNGGAGNDVLQGDGGDDALDGGPGDDRLDGIPGGYPDESISYGRDTYTGGGGGDSVTYEGRTEDLSLSPDGVANDGAAGEGDNIGPDVTAVYGGHGNDRLTGNAYRNLLSGGDGADELSGGDRDDHLVGGSGPDRLSGDAGQDLLGGQEGDDVLIGGPDVDRFYGDEITACIAESCPSGEDRIDARDGTTEVINCGPGTDSVVADTTDQIYDSGYRSDQCEAVDAAGGVAGGGSAGGGGSTPGGEAAAEGFQLIGRPKVRRGAIVVRLSAPGPGKLSVRAVAKRVRVAGASRSVQGGEATITLKPSAAAKRALRAKGKLKVSLTAVFTPAGGGAATKVPGQVTLRKGR